MSGKYKDAEPPKSILCRRCGLEIYVSWRAEIWLHRGGSLSCREAKRDEADAASHSLSTDRTPE